MSERKCVNCEFWLVFTRGDSAYEEGWCRRYPPSLSRDPDYNDSFPRTAREAWCGEFRARMAAIKTESEKKEEEESK